VSVRDQGTLEALWAAPAGGTPPTVPFDRELVVAAFLGMRPTPACSVRIHKVLPTESSGYAVRFIEEEVRGKNLFPDLIPTPFVISVLPLTHGEVTFEGSKVIVMRRKRKT
jgi:hypothetical protein